MNDVKYTDAPADVEKALERSKVLDISIDDLIEQNRKDPVIQKQAAISS